MDISLVCAIVKICCPSIHGNQQWIKDIKDTRNFLAHKNKCRLTKDEYDTWLAFVKNATLDLVKVVGSTFCKMIQKQISDFKKDKLSSNAVKDILASSNDDVFKVRCLDLSFYTGVWLQTSENLSIKNEDDKHEKMSKHTAIFQVLKYTSENYTWNVYFI